ncbi:MAG: hypothetical protein IPL39_00405 [Opitutaceae bacterium]|nr:hypothetical protein [Opitutaceae bacterium]
MPAYSPDLNAIETSWGKVKTILRAAQTRTHDALLAAIAKTLGWSPPKMPKVGEPPVAIVQIMTR